MSKDISRKIDSQHENPIDDILIRISQKISPFFKKLGYTPNGLTTISLLFSSIGLYNLYNKNVVQFSIFAILAYLFDVMDGNYARQYGMTSENGDKYDHFKDLFVIIATAYILYDKYDVANYPKAIIIMCVLIVLGIINMGCQERMMPIENRSNTLKVFLPVTPNENKCRKYIGLTKWFGAGTLVVAMILLVWYLNYDDGTSRMYDGRVYNDIFRNDQLTSCKSIGFNSSFDKPLDALLLGNMFYHPNVYSVDSF
jgi:phosphatidylglycerophosphate synthase